MTKAAIQGSIQPPSLTARLARRICSPALGLLKRARAGASASLDGGFDEAAYLAANPDVGAAVAAGRFVSGADHFGRFGRYENRPLAPPRTRRDRLLGDIDPRRATGVEIGALTQPLVRKDEGRIFYVDRASTQALKEHYRDEPLVDCDAIVDVDFIWGNDTLAEALGGRKVDYVVASHVIEHVPDVIAWLEEIRAILTVDGSLRLAIPDRRYSFDYLRNESNLADFLDAYFRKARAPLPRMILDCEILYRPVDVREAWAGRIDRAALAALPPSAALMEEIVAMAKDALDNGAYRDTHCWVFTPASFATMFESVAAMGLLHFVCEDIQPTQKDQLEFFAALKPCEDAALVAESWKRAREALSS